MFTMISLWEFSNVQGQLTPQYVIESIRNSNLSKIVYFLDNQDKDK